MCVGNIVLKYELILFKRHVDCFEAIFKNIITVITWFYGVLWRYFMSCSCYMNKEFIQLTLCFPNFV